MSEWQKFKNFNMIEDGVIIYLTAYCPDIFPYYFYCQYSNDILEEKLLYWNNEKNIFTNFPYLDKIDSFYILYKYHNTDIVLNHFPFSNTVSFSTFKEDEILLLYETRVKKIFFYKFVEKRDNSIYCFIFKDVKHNARWEFWDEMTNNKDVIWTKLPKMEIKYKPIISRFEILDIRD